jgi:hypothetical protein
MKNFITQSYKTVGQEQSNYGNHPDARPGTGSDLSGGKGTSSHHGCHRAQVARIRVANAEQGRDFFRKPPSADAAVTSLINTGIRCLTVHCKRKCSGKRRVACRVVWLVTTDWESQWIEEAGGDRP